MCNLRNFVARPFLSQIYALLSVKFADLKVCVSVKTNESLHFPEEGCIEMDIPNDQ